MGVLPCHERQDLVQHILLERLMAADAVRRVAPVAVQCFPIDAVDAIELEVARVELVAQGLDQAQVLVLEEASVAGRKDQHLGPGMAEHQEFHIATESLAEPTVILPVH